MKNFLILSIIILWSCTSEDLAIPESDGNVVVEGWLTDDFTNQTIRLTRSIPFSSLEYSPLIKDAKVEILAPNRTYSFIYQHDGIYQSSEKLSGIENQSYILKITLANEQIIYSIAEKMRSAPILDTLMTNSYFIPSKENPDIQDQIFYPITKIKDEKNESNYYRCKLYRNDTLFSDPENLILINDRFFDGNVTFFNNEFSNFQYHQGDSIGLELIEINERAYIFLSLLRNQTTTIGTTSSSTPSAINGNLYYLNSNEKVLGYWGTASVKKIGLKIQ